MTILQTPSLPSIDRAVATLLATASPKEQRQIDKAAHALHRGIEIVATTDGALLIPSSNRTTTYRLTAMGICSCPSTQKCYHTYISTILELAHAHGDDIDDPLPDPGPGGPGVPGDERPRTVDAARVVQILKSRRPPTAWEREDARQIAKGNIKAEMEQVRARPKLGYAEALAKVNELYG